jgi:hypothetical protein
LYCVTQPDRVKILFAWPLSAGAFIFKTCNAMENASRTIALMWKDVRGGLKCVLHRREDAWILSVERHGRTLRETVVESPGEAIRLAQAFREELHAPDHAA